MPKSLPLGVGKGGTRADAEQDSKRQAVAEREVDADGSTGRFMDKTPHHAMQHTDKDQHGEEGDQKEALHRNLLPTNSATK